MHPQIILTQEDITTLEVDVVVNAANKTLLGGGGVDGAIHRAAGSTLREETKLLGGCNTGEAKISGGHSLKAKYIIHTVGPYFGDENGREEELLRSCYINSLNLANNYKLKSIAFPCISTGVFRYPKDEAAKVALSSVFSFIQDNNHQLEEIHFAVFNELDYNIYYSLLNGELEVTF